MTRRYPISCDQADDMRDGLEPFSSLTNFIAGKVVDYRLPPMTATTWGNDFHGELLRDELDVDGCRHWRLATDTTTDNGGRQ